MRALELSLRNYRVFEEVDLELPARVIGIFGENGSGKTTLMESLLWALYGRARTAKNEIRTQGVLTDCIVRLVFDHGGSQYEVRRTISGRNHQTDAELFVNDLQLASGVTDVDAEIRKLLRMDQQVFRSSVFAEQKQLDAFSDLTAGKRKETVLRLLGIRPVDDARAAAKKEARATKHSADQLLGAVPDLARLEGELKEAKDVAREAKERHKAAAEELRESVALAKKAKKAFDDSDRARQRVEKIVIALEAANTEHDRLVAQRAELAERVERLKKDLEALPALEEERAALAGVDVLLRSAERLLEGSAKLAKLEAKLASLPAADVEASRAELKAAREGLREAQQAVAEIGAKRGHELELLGQAHERLARALEADPSQPCPTCGRPLGDDFPGYVKHCKEEAATAKKRAAAAERAARDAEAGKKRAEARLAKAERAGEEARAAGSERSQLVGQADSLRGEVALLAEPFGGAAPDPDALRAGVLRAKELGQRIAELGVERERLAEAGGDLAKAEARAAELEQTRQALAEEATELSFDAEEHARLRAEHEEADRRLDGTRAAEREATDEANRAELRVSGLEGEIKQAKETAARVEELRGEARYLDRVSALLDGFRDHLVSRIGPELSREAESLFRELTNHEYEDLRIDEDDLKIQIADGDAYFGIERFSGSETDLANLALRVAISMHLSRVSGADIGMMVLDEVLGSLDEERKDLMIQTLGRLSGRFHQLFVITHAERVKDQFPASIQVAKVGRRRSTALLV